VKGKRFNDIAMTEKQSLAALAEFRTKDSCKYF
jgi:hypothetical protein